MEKSTTESSVVYAKKGDKWLSRVEAKTTGTRKLGETPEEKIESKMLTILDGEFMYNLTESAQGKQAMKMKQPANDTFGDKMWEEMHKHFDMKLLPDETIDGKSTWVIESRPKAEKDATPEMKAAMEGTRSVTNYRKSDGAVLKAATYDKSGKTTMLMTMTDVKYDVDPKADAFKFTAPEGVTVMDMSNLGQAQQTEQPKEDNTAAQASPEPKEDEKPKEQPASRRSSPSPEKKGIGGLLNKLK